MGRSRYKITDSKQPHFVTLTVLHWIVIFTRPQVLEIMQDSGGCWRCVQNGNRYAFPRRSVGNERNLKHIVIPVSPRDSCN